MLDARTRLLAIATALAGASLARPASSQEKPRDNKIGAMALANRLAAVSFTESLVLGGAVACFAPDFQRVWPAAAKIAIRILRGEDVGAIPANRKLQLRNIINASR